MLFTDFGNGSAVLDCWQAWRADPARGERLDLIALCRMPPGADELRRHHAHTPRAAPAEALAACWPPPTRNVHRLSLDDGRVCLLLAVGNPAALLGDIRARVDAFVVDRAAVPRLEPVRLSKALARLAAPGARVHAALSVEQVGAALRSAGFRIDRADAAGIEATYAPTFTVRRRGRDRATLHGSRDAPRRALIVGGGLAGCAVAWALAEQGWSSVVIERRDGIALEASSNPAGLFHGAVHADDAVHARFNRAAALQAAGTVRSAIERDGVAGAVDGLIRLVNHGDVESMRAQLARLALPQAYVQALDAAEAGARCGLRLSCPAWHFPAAGWVDPAGLARSFLRRAGPAVELSLSRSVHALHCEGGTWHLLDARGESIERATFVVIAAAQDALRLLGPDVAALEAVRGQISGVALRRSDAADNWRLPRLPLAGSGYVLPAIGGMAWFGATAQPGDGDPAVRDADHRFNLERLRGLSPDTPPSSAAPAASWQGRVGWRCVAPDRLPLIGAVPDSAAPGRHGAIRLDDWPRRPGLYVFTALASRGITWCTLGARLLAAQMTGAPLPLEKPLVEAVDPARFLVRRQRRR